MEMRPYAVVPAAAAVLLGASCAQLTEPTDRGASARSQVTPAEVFGGQAWSQIAAGFRHTCALSADGRAYCWGANDRAQLGVPTATTCPEVGPCARRPVEVVGGLTFTRIAAGTTHTCALTAGGTAYCWGGGFEAGGAGFLGNGAIARSQEPVPVQADSAFTEIAVGSSNSCALTASGQLWCWGRNARGELGDGTQTARTAPVPIGAEARFSAVAMGSEHTCAIREGGGLLCWGHDRWGQLGISPTVAYNNFGVYVRTPTRVQDAGTMTAVVAGDEYTCGLRSDGRVLCWGRNENAGQLGDSSGVTHRSVAGEVAGNRSYSAIAGSGVTVCARATTGEAYCWGSNYFGAVGNGSRSVIGVETPAAVQGGPFVTLTVGGSHSCGITAAQRAFCWGDRRFGQIGD